MTRKLKDLPPNQPIILDNASCVYCGSELTDDNITKEHVIGRRFVPKGKLNQQWNLIVNACRKCNGKKSDLEDDISAITMQPEVSGNYARECETLIKEARRKAENSISRRTQKRVKDSIENIKIECQLMPGVNLAFNLTSAPQVEQNRTFELAKLQIMAFFYFITYNKDTKHGGFWQGGFFPVEQSNVTDWGNERLISFMKAVVDWEPRFLGIGANEYFKIIIRRHPSETCWSWGLEWNQKHRAVGFFGDTETAFTLCNSLCTNNTESLEKTENSLARYREEKKINLNDDILFYWPK